MVKKAAQAIPNRHLRQARLERGWTQKIVAERIGAPNDIMVTRWERGTAFPSPYYIERLCLLFEQKASDLNLLPEHAKISSSLPVDRQLLAHSSEEQARKLVASALPVPLTSFFGREHEIAAIAALLRNSSVRLITLTGPGGVGKTRLALALATEVADAFVDGVGFVPLAPIRDPEQVLPAIAQALGLWRTPGSPLFECIQNFLREKQMLLLLDNFEQVVAASPQVAMLARACPNLHLLTTSRAALHLSGEREFPVPPLSLPDLTQLMEPGTLAQVASVQLFVERAQAIQPAFALTEANAHAISEICLRLDGLPLALELAAARIKFLPPQALLARLSRRIPILTGGARDLPERQQTLRETLQWSYDLLTPQERLLFCRLSVFVGGCTLQAATAVCNQRGKEPLDVLEGSASLVDKSFMVQTTWEEETPRLLMLEIIREYGLERLEMQGEMAAMRRAHALYYLSLAQKASERLEGAERTIWLERVEHEGANLSAALLWALEQQECEVALHLSGALFRFWEARHYLHVSRGSLEYLTAISRSIPAPGGASPLSPNGFLVTFQRSMEGTAALSQEAGVEHCEGEDSRQRAFSFYLLGYIAWATGDFASARSHAEEGLSVAKASEETVLLAALTVLLGKVAFEEGEVDRASLLLEEGLALQQACGDTRGRVSTLAFLLRVLFVRNEASLVRLRNNEYLELSRALDFRWGIAESLAMQGHLEWLEGNEAEARELCEGSLALARESGDHGAIAACLSSIGVTFASQGLIAEAACLWSAATKMCAARGEALLKEVLLPVEYARGARSLMFSATELGEEAFSAAWIKGMAMTEEQVLALLKRQDAKGKRKTASDGNKLTVREMDVLRVLVQGLTSAQMAEQLKIGLVTVNSHIRSIYRKLGVSSRSAVTRFALEHHLF